MTGPISRNRLLGSLKEAASWPGADRNTVVTLATTLVAARADAEGSSYFQDLSGRNPADATLQALAGFFQVRAGDEAAEALRRSGLGPVAAGRPPVFTSFSVTARDGLRVSAPGTLSPAPGVHVAQSYTLGDFAFIQTSAGLVAIDAGTSPDRVRAAMADLGLTDQAPVSHLILTHAHLDHTGGTAALRGPGSPATASSPVPAQGARRG